MESGQDLLGWKNQIRKWGTELGFAAVGFTSAEAVAGLAPMLQGRFAQGLATPFEEKEVNLRVDPKANWQRCRTVVALAFPLPYTAPPRAGEGIIARSAVGEDYHRVLRAQIDQLAEMMISNGWPPETLRWQVDTGPLVERALAIRAGLGWLGRNQQLIIPGYGSFVALGLLLLDREILPDQPVAEQCGACRKCVQACPAQIIGREPFAAKHCLSYLTQSKELLSPEEGQSLGLRIFGCDTCQEVCPHNHKRLEKEQEDLSRSFYRQGVDLLETLSLTKGEFRKQFQGTAAGWRGKGILQRNAFLAMQNIQDPRLEPWLAEQRRDNSVPPILSPYLEVE